MSEKKGATRQSFIRKEITTYRIGTLIIKIYKTFKDVQMMLKHFLISLLVSDIKKLKKSSPSIYRDVHAVVHHFTLKDAKIPR